MKFQPGDAVVYTSVNGRRSFRGEILDCGPMWSWQIAPHYRMRVTRVLFWDHGTWVPPVGSIVDDRHELTLSCVPALTLLAEVSE